MGGARQQQVACTARTMSKDRCLVVDQSGSKLYMGRVLCTSANIFKTKLETHFGSGANIHSDWTSSRSDQYDHNNNYL